MTLNKQQSESALRNLKGVLQMAMGERIESIVCPNPDATLNESGEYEFLVTVRVFKTQELLVNAFVLAVPSSVGNWHVDEIYGSLDGEHMSFDKLLPFIRIMCWSRVLKNVPLLTVEIGLASERKAE